MATPNFDYLSVELASLLGDPFVPGGGAAVTATTDGVAYTAAMRANFLTLALRTLINDLGHSFLHEAGYIEGYVRDFNVTADEMTVPAGVERILHVDYYGRKALYASFAMLSRLNHTHWQNVPMWRIYDDAGVKKLKVYNFKMFSAPIPKAYYLRTIPALASGGTNEDILLGKQLFPLLLKMAEYIGRRHHQELAQVLIPLADKEKGSLQGA